MRKYIFTLFVAALLGALAGCEAKSNSASSAASSATEAASSATTSAASTASSATNAAASVASAATEAASSAASAASGSEASAATQKSGTTADITTSAEQSVTMPILQIKIGEHILTAELADNSSAEALVDLLEREGCVTIDMHDYSNFEKVGELPEELPRNDEQIDTQAGDLILYLGKRFVIYYDHNSWDFTRLGWLRDITQSELKEILGDGDVVAELSLAK